MILFYHRMLKTQVCTILCDTIQKDTVRRDWIDRDGKLSGVGYAGSDRGKVQGSDFVAFVRWEAAVFGASEPDPEGDTENADPAAAGTGRAEADPSGGLPCDPAEGGILPDGDRAELNADSGCHAGLGCGISAQQRSGALLFYDGDGSHWTNKLTGGSYEDQNNI